jgi:hypothetical protein
MPRLLPLPSQVVATKLYSAKHLPPTPKAYDAELVAILTALLPSLVPACYKKEKMTRKMLLLHMHACRYSQHWQQHTATSLNARTSKTSSCAALRIEWVHTRVVLSGKLLPRAEAPGAHHL